MAAIIRQLLDFARRRSVTKLPLDVADIVQVTAELLQAFAAKKNISLRVRDDCDGRDTVELDGEQIQQALANLVMNAIHAADRGGAVEISLAVETATPPAGHSGRPGQYVVVSVSDNGAGIADADLPHIFEPFFTTKDIGDGTGLGLSVTYGIVRDHGGWIDVASAVGEGSLFRVFLPVESAV
jgi:signal transduction histidine kinase